MQYREKQFKFSFSRIPSVIFKPGSIRLLHENISKYGHRALIITGGNSLKSSGRLEEIKKICKKNKIEVSHISVNGEPSPEIIDKTVEDFNDEGIEAVVSIGGGSVIDAGKAVSAMLGKPSSVYEYLEDVGRGLKHDGTKIPFIAVPTTSGTGSEATKNAVLSRPGEHGFKKSLRHENFIPELAVIDPELMISCPRKVTAYCGLDAFTQLLESFVSKQSSFLTDDLALIGMKLIGENIILAAAPEGSRDIYVRSKMAYAAFLSGVTLANAGLCLIHGLASAIGGFYDIPHGLICGSLSSSVIQANIKILKKRGDYDVLGKYQIISNQLSDNKNNDPELLVDIIDSWLEELNIPKLGEYGVSSEDINAIIENTSLKNNPVLVSRSDIKNILKKRI